MHTWAWRLSRPRRLTLEPGSGQDARRSPGDALLCWFSEHWPNPSPYHRSLRPGVPDPRSCIKCTQTSHLPGTSEVVCTLTWVHPSHLLCLSCPRKDHPTPGTLFHLAGVGCPHTGAAASVLSPSAPQPKALGLLRPRPACCPVTGSSRERLLPARPPPGPRTEPLPPGADLSASRRLHATSDQRPRGNPRPLTPLLFACEPSAASAAPSDLSSGLQSISGLAL